MTGMITRENIKQVVILEDKDKVNKVKIVLSENAQNCIPKQSENLWSLEM